MNRGVWQAKVHEVSGKELDKTEHARVHTHIHARIHTEGGRERGGKLLETKRINCLSSSLLELLKHHVTSI